MSEQLAWVAAWGGMSLLPDLDSGGWTLKGGVPRGHGSTVARMWGAPTMLLAAGLGKLARGHRNGTHDAIVAPALFGLLAAAAALHPWSSLALLAFAIGLALHACHVFVPGRAEVTVVGNLALSWGAAFWFTDAGHGTVPWLPLAVAGGVLVHIAGDSLTVGGCPVPFTWLDGKPTRYALGLFRTGAWPEKWLLAPAFLLVALWLVASSTGADAQLTTYLRALR